MNRVERLNKYKAVRKNPKGPAKRLYSIPEAAFYLGRTVDALREILWAGTIPYVKDGRRVLLDEGHGRIHREEQKPILLLSLL